MAVSVTTVALVSGPLVSCAYAVGAAMGSRRAPDLSSVTDADGEVDAFREPVVLRALVMRWLVDGVATLAAATVVWHVIRRLSPGPKGVQVASAVGFLSPQVLTPWQSVTLWAGVAVVLGHVAPIFLGLRRGGTGLAPAVALLAAYAPTIMFAGGVAGFGAQLATGRSRLAVPAATVAWGLYGWLAFSFDWPTLWGWTHGPELSVWVLVMSGIVFARWVVGDRHRLAPGDR